MIVFIALSNKFTNSVKIIFPRPGKDYALFFAVSNYKNSSLTNLPNSITDARAIADVLEKSYGFKSEVIADPTLDMIEQKLNEYRDKFAKGTLPKDGQLLIFFSGNGVKEYNNGYFLPTDADPSRLSRTAFAYNIWRPIISELQCQHILVAVDACYSVTFDPSWESKNDPKFQRIGELSETERILENHKAYKNRIFFTADAKENVVPGRSNFARKLLEGLTANQYKGSFITSTELFASYVQKAQPSPRASFFEGDDPNSSFLFFPTQQVKVDPQRFDQRQRDIEAYGRIQQSPTVIACQQYLTDFPEGAFRSEVTALLLQLQDEQEWQFALLKNNNAAYENYLRLYPKGKYKLKAQKAIKTGHYVEKNQNDKSKDSDNDGISDSIDKEPYNPPRQGEKVNSDGVILLESGLHLPMIHFGTSSYAITFSDYGTLASIARMMKSNIKLRLVITGFTDHTGEQENNEFLSYQRAKIVIDHIANNHGVNADRLVLQYKGKEEPLVPSAASYMNRRVEFRVANVEDKQMDRPLHSPNVKSGY